MKTLTIEREFGSGGRMIGAKVAETANIPFYDANLMVEAAHNYGISLDLLKEYDEQKTGSLLYNIALLSNYSQNSAQSKSQGLFYGIQETIKKLHAEGPAVFVGRCSTDILYEDSDAVSVYIYSSDRDKKIKQISEYGNISEADAGRLLEKRDKQRRDYFKFWTGKEWAERKNYDIELNTARIATEECVNILLGALGRA